MLYYARIPALKPAMRLRDIVPPILIALFLLFFQTLSAQQPPLRIAAASDLQPVLPPILGQFQRATGIPAVATYQASAALTAQILNGAPFDVFLAADLSYPRRLIDAGLADSAGIPAANGSSTPSTPVIYARGSLVLWTRKEGPFPSPSLATLTDPRLQRLAIADPDRAPYGRAALAALTSLKLAASLKPKLVTAENISQTAQFAETGNADAGLISLTSAKSPHLLAIGNWFLIPKDLYPPIEQGAVIISHSPQRENAQKFLAFLLSPAIQKQLGASGLTPVN